jgi:quercetin dioxygenase-like cupin family protein
MKIISLAKAAAEQPSAWRSAILGKAGGANFKVLRMDGAVYADEVHDFDEALLVVDGQMNLLVDGQVHCVKAGDVCIVPAGLAHGVAEGSFGTLVIVDQ